MRVSYLIILLTVLFTGCAGSSSVNDSGNTSSNSSANTNASNTAANTNASTAAKLPEFPWPPDASAFTTIPSQLLAKEGTTAKLGDIDNRLRGALQKAGYEQLGYYHIPGGFVLITPLEQFDGATGAPLSGTARWSTTVVPPKTFTKEYFRGLIKGNSGHFRVIAFAVTNEPFNQTGKEISAGDVPGIEKHAANTLPPDVKEKAYDENYQCTALIYEFLQPNSGQTTFVHSSNLLASKHLQTILPLLEQTQ